MQNIKGKAYKLLKMNLEQLLQDKTDTRVFVDTCTLMHPKLEQFLAKVVPVLSLYGYKMVVPWSCIEELYKHTTNPKLKLKAEKAFKELDRLSQYVDIRGNEADGTHADNVFLRVFTQFRTKYRLILISEDKGLKTDILKLNSSKSVKGHHIYVYGVDDILGVSKTHTKKKPYFHFCTQLTTTPDTIVTISELPKEGDVVYDKVKTPIRLTEKISEGGEGCVYNTSKSGGAVAKIYFDKKLTSHKQSKINALIASGLSIDGVCFPTAHLYNSKGVFVGYLMPKAEGKKLDVSVFKGERGMERCFASWTRQDLVSLAITILTIIKKIHKSGILIGDINGSNILVKSSTEVYFVDTDSFQINDYPCPVGTMEFTAPEIQGKNYNSFLRTVGNENFAVAVLLFRLMMFGMNPYSQQGGSGIEHNIRTGDFSFPYKENSNNKIPKGDWCYFWSHLFFKLKEHFYCTFRKGEARFKEKNRPGVDEWLSDLFFYKKQLQDGTLEGIDKESLKMFPKTYKKAKGVVYRTCLLCHQEKPENLVSKSGYCYECLNGTTEAVCTKCGKTFTYRNRLALKYGSIYTSLCNECKQRELDRKREEKERLRKEREERQERKRKEQEYRNSVYKYVTCTACHRQFEITNGEHDYLVSKGLDMPKRCRDCRANGNRPASNHGHDSSSSGGCFITTAVCEYFGREDDCYELTMLRSFRDNWLSEQKNGKLEISLYYDCAPKLVEKMKSSTDYAATCEELMNKYIRPCVELIKRHKEEECRQLYIKGLQYMLNKYQLKNVENGKLFE